MMKKQSALFGLVFGMNVLVGTAYAATEGLKIAVIDMQKALIASEPGKKAKEKLEKEGNTRGKELQSEQGSLQKAVEEFRKQSLVMSDEARRKKNDELQERAMKFQQAYQGLQAEMAKKEQEATLPMVARLKSVAAEVGKQKGYALVLEQGAVIYTAGQDDITADVISAFNKQSSAK